MSAEAAYKKVFGRPNPLKKPTPTIAPGAAIPLPTGLWRSAWTKWAFGEITIGVPPVGCAVLAYNYFNFDMVEAPHGRALAVATGIKRVRPESFVL